MKWRRVTMAASAVVSVISVLSVLIFGMNYGIDFTGGVIVEVTYPSAADVEKIRTELEGAGVREARVQTIGSLSDVIIRLPPPERSGDVAETREQVLGILRMQDPGVQLVNADLVSSQVGEDLAQRGFLALVFALLMIFIYVMLRFRWKLAVGAIVATVHDIVVVVGAFSIFRWQFDLTVLGSVLAVLGWSLNDTVVLYDRIRDNFRSMRRGDPVSIVNTSVNQTLSRTIVTGLTTLLVVVVLFFMGGDTLRGFSLALIIGIIVGTYSSIYIASAMALALNIVPADLVAQKRAPVDELP